MEVHWKPALQNRGKKESYSTMGFLLDKTGKKTHTRTLVCAGGTSNLLKSLEKKLEGDHQHISPLPSFLELQAHACLSVLNTDIIIKKLLTHLLCPKVRFTSQFLQLVIEWESQLVHCGLQLGFWIHHHKIIIGLEVPSRPRSTRSHIKQSWIPHIHHALVWILYGFIFLFI